MHKKNIPILMYHSIQSEKKGAKLRGLSVSPMLFKVQMFTLKLLGYKGLSMGNLEPYLTGKKRGKVFGITFDDGYQNNYIFALPILKKYRFTATCYIISNNIDGINHWDIKKGITIKKMMNHNEIKDWINEGMEIGSHSSNHLYLSKLDNNQLKEEVLHSKINLQKQYKTKIKHFCYPYGDKDSKIVEFVRKCGYVSATTTSRGLASPQSNLFELPRVLINHRTYPHLLLLKFLTNYENNRQKT